MSMPTHTFRHAVESHDLQAMIAQLADEVVLWSPLAFRPFEGKGQVSRLLEVLMTEVFEDFAYTDELRAEDGTHALVFRTRVGGREIQGLDLLRHDATGRINDFTVMVRPASAMQALGAAVAPRYEYITTGA